MGPYVVVTGAASVGARESSLTVGYEGGSGYLVEGLSEGTLLVLESEAWPFFVLEARLPLEPEVRLASELDVFPALEVEARLAL